RGEISDRNVVPLGTDIRHNAPGGIPAPLQRQVQSATVKTYFTNGTYRLLIDQVTRLAESRTGDLDGRQRLSSGNFFPAPSPDDVIDEDAPLAPSQWARRMEVAAYEKINPVYPGVPGTAGDLIDPVWIEDYGQAASLADQPGLIKKGMYISLEFRREPRPAGGYGPEELVMWGLKRTDPPQALQPDPTGTIDWVRQGNSNVWRLDAPNPPPGPGSTETHYIYYDLWVGVNTGDFVAVRNPYNFTPSDRNDLPGPVNFTIDEVGTDTRYPSDEFRRESMTFLGIAHQPKEAAFTPERFDGERTDRKLVGLAQAEVFNNHSWDLWTQMWHAQLVPIYGFDVWMDVLEEPVGTDQMPWLEEADVTAVTGYLRAVEPLAPLMLEH
ncbi:MAG: hypothetical protein AAGL98_05495, partial [Planctomycetota bacterium]